MNLLTKPLIVCAVLLGLWNSPGIRAQDADTNTPVAKAEVDAGAAATNTESNASEEAQVRKEAVVVFGRDVELKEGETAEAVVVIGGSVKIRGKVRDAAVVIGGNLDVEGQVGDAAVAVMGNITAREGAKIGGEVVAVGGKADIAKGAKVGRVQEVDVGMGLPRIEPLKSWFVHCVLKLRPLAPQVGWVWVVWSVFLLLYMLIAAAFPRPVQACVDELTRRPATTFLMGILTKLLLPIVLVILAVTVIGVVVIPFLVAALFLGFLVGKVAILQALGSSVGRQFTGQGTLKPVVALLFGALIITVLYLVPILGLITFGVVSVWGLGSAVMAAFGGFRRELPQKPALPVPAGPPPGMPPSSAAPGPPTPAPVAPAAGGFASDPVVTAGPQPAPAAPAATFEATPPESIKPEIPAPAASPGFASAQPALVGGAGGAAVAALPDAWAFPKATFWERMGAAFLDVVLVSILGGLVGGPPQGFLVALAYFAGMWAWRATTIGSIVIGLKVARMDGQPLTFVVALVRGLAAAFSVIVLFLGFLWIIWDKDKQAWHDKIAGTVVVKLPRGTPLVCF